MSDTIFRLLAQVRRHMADRLEKVDFRGHHAEWCPRYGQRGLAAALVPGKMLRTRLAGRLLDARAVRVDEPTLALACAATELVHTASLCHDDVIDNALIRRGRPTLWRMARSGAAPPDVLGPSGAVLVGDVLFCEALALLLDVGGGRYVRMCVEKMQEVCAAEAEQETRWRGRRPDAATCLRLARGKTGPLFAFVGQVCGTGDGADPRLAAALEEAGYRIGTAYQIADDLVDVVGEETAVGKTLGRDADRGKVTLPAVVEGGAAGAVDHVRRLFRSALECVSAWPAARRGLERYLADDLRPYTDRHIASSLSG